MNLYIYCLTCKKLLAKICRPFFNSDEIEILRAGCKCNCNGPSAATTDSSIPTGVI